MRKEIVFGIEDLRYVEIECPHCHTKVILDMQQPAEFAQKHDFFAPRKCPGCETSYDSAIQPGVDRLQKAYAELLRIGDRVRFHKPVEGD